MLCFNVSYAHSRSSHPFIVYWADAIAVYININNQAERYHLMMSSSSLIRSFLTGIIIETNLTNTNDYSITSRVPDNILTPALTAQNNRSGYFLCKWQNHVEQFRINKYIPLLSIHSFAQTSFIYAFLWIIHPLIWTVS